MAIAIGDTYKAYVKFRVSDQLMYNVFSFRSRSAGQTTITINPIFNGLVAALDAFAALVVGYSTTALEYIECGATFEAGAGNLHQTVRSRSGGVGTQTAELLPHFTSAVVRHSTGLAGRSRRGRTHLIGLHEGHQANGVLSTQGLTDLGLVMTFLNSSAWRLPQHWEFVVYSRTLRLRQEPEWVWPVENSTLSNVLGTMYSRRLGIGS